MNETFVGIILGGTTVGTTVSWLDIAVLLFIIYSVIGLSYFSCPHCLACEPKKVLFWPFYIGR